MDQPQNDLLLKQLLESIQQLAVNNKQIADSFANLERLYAIEVAKNEEQRKEYVEDRKYWAESQKQWEQERGRIEPTRFLVGVLAFAAILLSIAQLVVVLMK